jgi:thiamine-monophosphate kinase
MGGEPQAAFLSLAVSEDVLQRWVDGFMTGLLELAQKLKVPLAGGDTAQSVNGIQADIVVVGSVPRGKAVLRSGAKAGEQVYVTGDLGGSAAALARLFHGSPVGANQSRHFHPMPRVEVGRWLRERGVASAMIDVSDGLSTDLEHICSESGVGAEIEAEAIPRGSAKTAHSRVELKYALNGGDDYELLFTTSRNVPSKIAGVPVTRIGQTTKRLGMALIDTGGKKRKLKAEGWQHFGG